MIIEKLKFNLEKKISKEDLDRFLLSRSFARLVSSSVYSDVATFMKEDISGLSIINFLKKLANHKEESEAVTLLLRKVVISLFNNGYRHEECPILTDDLIMLMAQREDGLIYDGEGVLQKAEDLIIVLNAFYKKNSKYVVKDYLSGKYILAKQSCAFNMLGVDSKGKTTSVKLNTLEQNSDRLVAVYSNKHSISSLCLYDEDIFSELGLKEDFKTGAMIDEEDKPSDRYPSDYHTFKSITRKYSLDLKTMVSFGIKSPTNSITEGLPYKFGVELEVNQGSIPPYAAHKNMLNISSVRDGSINNGNGGAEIVTGVLYGDSGFMNLQKICSQLSLRATVDKTTGLHVHLGGIDFTDQFIVNSYIIFRILENEMFSLLPKSRRENRYCRRLKDIPGLKVAMNNNRDNIELMENYNKIFQYVSHTSDAQHPNSKFNKTTQHPLGAKCGYSRDTQRYCWINYVPAVYNTRGDVSNKTIEIRNHQGTTSFVKTKNWILLFMAICSFTEKHFDLINNKLTIDDILTKIYPRNHKKLIEFFKRRKELFSHAETEEIEYSANKESIKKLKEIIYT